MSHPFVSEYLDRHGKRRVRFRRAGISVPLPPTDSATFEEEYRACLRDASAMALLAKRPPPNVPLVSQARIFLSDHALPAVGEYLYFVHSSARRVKIGFSTSPLKRFGSLTTNCPDKLTLLAIVRGSKADEAAWHERYSEARISGEWFRSTEALKAAIRQEHLRTLSNRGVAEIV